MNITLGGTFPYLLLMIVFIVVITLYTPLIYQYDALAMYLIEGRQLIDGSFSLAGTWPTFGDSMPVMPIIYSWFFHLSDAPILRFIPLTLFFLTIFLVYTMGRKFSPKNPSASYISMVSLVSMTAVQWYMAMASLYLDLILIFLTASSIYLLILTLEKNSTPIVYCILGMNLALLMLSKEFGIFYVWFVIVILLFSYNIRVFQKLHDNLVLGLLLLAPHIILNYSFTSLFYDLSYPKSIFQIFLCIPFIVFLSVTFPRENFQGVKSNLLLLTSVAIPFCIPALFFVNNLFSLGVPFGTMTEPYIQQLLELGLVWPLGVTTDVSFSNLFDLFFTHTLMASNLVPLLFFFSALIIKRFRKLSNHSSLLASWFLYSLFNFYFFSFGKMQGEWIRRILPLTIPVALIVGIGINYLLSLKAWPSWVGTITYTFATSMIAFYLWFIKLEISKRWVINLNLLIIDLAKANYQELLIYTTPWLFLLIVVSNKYSLNFRFGSKVQASSWRLTYFMGLILILISTMGSATILNQVIKYPNTWDPAYYDKFDSIEPYGHHWHIPTIEFYFSRLSEDDSDTIGFGVSLFQFFLKRSFIDLNHPKNWLIYLPVLQSISNEKLLSYLEKLDIKYFLIPNEVHGGRFRYESVLENSTLFKLIETNAVIIGDDGEMFKFEKLDTLWIFDLYTLKPILPSKP